MHTRSTFLTAGIAAVVFGLGLCGATPANAEMLTFNYVHIGGGTALAGSLTATVADTGANQVTVTMSSNMTSGFVTDWAFNLKPSFTGYTGLSHDAGAVTGGATKPDTIELGPADSVVISGSISGFDIGFHWTSGNHGFDGTSSVTYVLSYSGTQTFNAGTFNALNSSGSWYSAAKVQGIGTGKKSGEVGTTTPPPSVPEPNSLALMGIGSTGLLGLWYRRRLRGATETEI